MWVQGIQENVGPGHSGPGYWIQAVDLEMSGSGTGGNQVLIQK